MTVNSKIIVTAEDRTRAAFASIERNTAKTAMALAKMQGQMLKLAGMGSLVAFFRTGAESTEKWRDEMARLNDITNEFFKNAADNGQLNAFVLAVKTAHVAALGLGTGLEMAGLSLGAFAAATADFLKGNFTEAYRTTGLLEADLIRSAERFGKLKDDIFAEAPQGYAKHREEEADRVKNAAAKIKKAESDRAKTIKTHSTEAEDAIRAESEISGDQSGAGLTAMGAGVFDEARAKEAELAAAAEEKQRERLMRQVEIMNESFMTEKELLQAQYEEKGEILGSRQMEELIGAEEQNRLLEELERQHQANMGNVSAQGVLARRKFEEMNTQQQVQHVLGSLQQLTQGVASNNKTMFQINKAAGIGNALINTYLGVTKALSAYPPPWSIAMAAVQLAAGMAQVQQIKSAQFGTATSAPSISGGGATPVYNAADSGVPDLSVAEAKAKPAINLTLVGSTFTATQIRDDIIPLLNEAYADGYDLSVRTA